MSVLIIAYWFAVVFLLVFFISAGLGLAFGFPLREVMVSAFWQSLVISLFLLAMFAAVMFGTYLMGVAS